MNKCLLLIFVLIIFSLNVQAWNSQTHQLLVANVYYTMPPSLQEKLNLTLMKEGAVAPDLVFHDTVKHHYPDSKVLAEKYLSKISTLEDFSFNFGVAAHYMGDSFVAPHNVQKEDSALHSKFEKQVNGYSIATKCGDYNYTLDDLYLGTKNEGDWYTWLENQDKTIPEKELEQAQQFIYSIAIQKLGYECNSQLIYEEKPLFNPKNIINTNNLEIPNKATAYPIILAVLALFLAYKIFKKRREIITSALLLVVAYLIYKFLKLKGII